YKMVNSSEQGMLAAAKKKISAHKPIAFQGWHPHLMFRMFDIKMLKDPKHIFPADDVKIGVAKGLKKKSPTAYTLFSNMSFSIDEVEKWLLQMENKGIDPKKLAEKWVKNHKKRVQKWLKSQ
ncbi:MAG TPA: glycine betaine ABC transporter substrate-binding protein, partial [Bacillales bacterium]